MNDVLILGFLAGSLTTASFIPQLIKVWRSRSTADISLVMYIAFTVGIILWIIYGFMCGSLPVIITNFITLAITFVILGLKLRYK